MINLLNLQMNFYLKMINLFYLQKNFYLKMFLIPLWILYLPLYQVERVVVTKKLAVKK